MKYLLSVLFFLLIGGSALQVLQPTEEIRPRESVYQPMIDTVAINATLEQIKATLEQRETETERLITKVKEQKAQEKEKLVLIQATLQEAKLELKESKLENKKLQESLSADTMALVDTLKTIERGEPPRRKRLIDYLNNLRKNER